VKAPRIDLYLAAVIKPSPDLARRLRLAKVDGKEVARAKAEAERALFTDPLKLRPAALVRFFGPPSTDDVFSISYDLTLWPDHRYEWHVGDAGNVGHGGFIRRNPDALPTWVDRNPLAAERFLQPWYHTLSDVVMAMGQPDVDASWFPQQTWYYGPLIAGQDLVLDFDLGLLRAVAVEPSVVDQHRKD
jgi:hypothetical protein